MLRLFVKLALSALAMVALLGMLTSAEDWKHFDCGTVKDHASDHFLQTIKDLHNDKTGGSAASRAAAKMRPRNVINVPTYFHVVTTNAKKSQFTQDMANKQIAAMNKAYQPAGVQFQLKGTDFTANDQWAVGEDADTTNMKKALRKGTYNTLNIYFHSDLAGGVLGKCTLPAPLIGKNPDPSTYNDDGCQVQANTMPGGTAMGFNSGMTAVHETGHWMGLLHVFEGDSCSGDGDFIADTPMQSNSTSGCPSSQDSCPGQPGLDSIHNYMDYSDDACYQNFTPNQVARMTNMWGMYRQGN